MTQSQKSTISLLCPTRGRPHYLLTHLDSIVATASSPERLEVMFFIDRDDPMAVKYEALLSTRSDGLNIVTLVGDRVGTPKAINAMAARSTGQCLMISNDDLHFVTPGWDDEADRALAEQPDGIFNLFFNDGFFGDKLSCFPIIGRRWYETLGYVAPVLFEHCNVDLWIHRLGALLDRNIYRDGIMLDHQHFADDPAGNQFNWQAEGPAQRRLGRDNAYFKIFERYMKLDLGLLQDAIAQRAPRYPIPKEAEAVLSQIL